jgi:hypothetical protein
MVVTCLLRCSEVFFFSGSVLVVLSGMRLFLCEKRSQAKDVAGVPAKVRSVALIIGGMHTLASVLVGDSPIGAACRPHSWQYSRREKAFLSSAVRFLFVIQNARLDR